MNKLFSILLVIFSINLDINCQTVKIEGTAFNTYKTRKDKRVGIVVNDTLNTLLKKGNEETLKDFANNKSNWKKYITRTNRRGKFKIYADIKDSISFVSSKHTKKSFLVDDLLKLDNINVNLKLINCDDYKCKLKPKLLIVSGQKVSFEPKEYNHCTSNSLNSEWSAEYSVDSLFYGNYKNTKINFKVSLHAAKPSVQKYENVILYIYNSCDRYSLLRGGYDAIYRTKNGEFATTYSTFFLNKIPEKLRPKPKKINFIEPVIIKFHKNWDDDYISKRWYEPYYTIKDRTAIANYGFYIEDVIKIKSFYLKEQYNLD